MHQPLLTTCVIFRIAALSSIDKHTRQMESLAHELTNNNTAVADIGLPCAAAQDAC
jgi:hypothetical protein